jgi:hypothetical protein
VSQAVVSSDRFSKARKQAEPARKEELNKEV